MKFNFNEQFIGLDGKTPKESAACPHCKKDVYEGVSSLTLGQRAANMLSGEKSIEGIDSLRVLDLSMQLYKEGVVDLTTKEQAAIEEYFNSNKTNVSILLKAQILKLMKNHQESLEKQAKSSKKE